MELDKFISKSLKSIIKGIKDSQDFANENGARINPHVGKWDFDKNETTYFGNEEGARAVSKIDFDVAVTISNSQETGGEGGINVYSLKLGGKLSDTEINESVSRIKFSLNVALPNSKP
ncbi:MAG: hypothetical protein KKC03_11610 [Bacteroidetes bacterium]|nr:hypothetical protein [Bacteroidota bacterium]